MKNLFLVFILCAILVSTIECKKKLPTPYVISDPTRDADLARIGQALQPQAPPPPPPPQLSLKDQMKIQLQELEQQGKDLYAKRYRANLWWEAYSEGLRTCDPKDRENVLSQIAYYKNLTEQLDSQLLQNGKQITELKAQLGIIQGSVRVSRQ